MKSYVDSTGQFARITTFMRDENGDAIPRIEAEIRKMAKKNLEPKKKSFMDKAVKIFAAASKVIPVGQPALAAAGMLDYTPAISANLNVYHTTWSNRTLVRNNGLNDDEFRSSQTFGVKQVHYGVELEVFTRPLDNLRLNGFLSLGEWQFKDNATLREFDQDGTQVEPDKEIVTRSSFPAKRKSLKVKSAPAETPSGTCQRCQ